MLGSGLEGAAPAKSSKDPTSIESNGSLSSKGPTRLSLNSSCMRDPSTGLGILEALGRSEKKKVEPHKAQLKIRPRPSRPNPNLWLSSLASL